MTAILAVDMAGYSRLMEQNEEDILTRQKVHRKELFDPQIATRGGRIVKTTGDGMLVEFVSAQDAVRCAINIQVAMADREGASPGERRILYRLGINLGDVLFEDGDIFGDGVNVASRLEGLAKPGGICISDIVHQAVADKIKVPFRDMGNQRVKNISRPIRVWQWTLNEHPCEMPRSANRLSPAAAATVDMSPVIAPADTASTPQSDRPFPRWSNRTSRHSPANLASHGCQIGLRHSYSRWFSQFGAFSTGIPWPILAHAICTPSGAVANCTCCCCAALGSSGLGSEVSGVHCQTRMGR
ncbi:adenylate/guanylate cyclase domain-containing protein [Rhizobium ruizarguesonis]